MIYTYDLQKSFNSHQKGESMALIRYFTTEKSWFFADLPVCSKTLLPFHSYTEIIPNKLNYFSLSPKILFSSSFYFHRNLTLFLIYFSSSDGTRFICCLVAQSSSHHPHPDCDHWLLRDPGRHFSIGRGFNWPLTGLASVRVTLTRKRSEEKLKPKLILIPSNLFSLIFNTYYRKEK